MEHARMKELDDQFKDIDSVIYESAFKRKGSGKLVWIQCSAENEKEALKKMREYTGHHYPKHRLYAGPLIQHKPQQSKAIKVTDSLTASGKNWKDTFK